MTRINVKVKSNEESEINGLGPVIHDDELEQMFKKLDELEDGDILVLAGSIPATLPSDVYERIMDVCRKRHPNRCRCNKRLVVKRIKISSIPDQTKQS